jgi:hypothetical protein
MCNKKKLDVEAVGHKIALSKNHYLSQMLSCFTKLSIFGDNLAQVKPNKVDLVYCNYIYN